MNREEKKRFVDNLGSVFAGEGVVVVVGYKGMTVENMQDLRQQLSQVEGKLKVVKNKLAHRASADTSVALVQDLFKGQTAVSYSPDYVGVPKVLVAFAKSNENLVILGGVLNGEVLDVGALQRLAKTPSLDVLRGTIVGILQAPAQKLASLLKAPARAVAAVLAAQGAKPTDTPAASAAPDAPAASDAPDVQADKDKDE